MKSPFFTYQNGSFISEVTAVLAVVPDGNGILTVYFGTNTIFCFSVIA